MNGKYAVPLEKYKFGDLISVEEWIEGCEIGPTFIDYDGFGHPVKGDMVDPTEMYPSMRKNMPEDTTHIIWFNR